MAPGGPEVVTRSRFSQPFLLVAVIVSEVTATLSLKGALRRPALYLVVVLGSPSR
jgi:hypothetical protein